MSYTAEGILYKITQYSDKAKFYLNMNLNKVMIIGRLAADPESRSTPNGQQVTNIRVATSRVWNDQAGARQEQTDFHSVTVWGKQAENCAKFLVKGQLVSIEGRLQNRSWQAQDGTKRYATDIIADSVQFGPKASGVSTSSSGQSFGESAPRAQTTSASFNKPSAKKTTPTPAKEDDIPIININEDFPVSNPMISDSNVNEVEIDLKDIPF